MKVLKFGGTSVGSAERMKHVANLVQDGEKKIVVLSAMAGTTNTLLKIAAYVKAGSVTGAENEIYMLELKYEKEVQNLFSTEEWRENTWSGLKKLFLDLREETHRPYSLKLEKRIVFFGEVFSTFLFENYMRELGADCASVFALDFMRLNEDSEPDMQQTEMLLSKQLHEAGEHEIIITQGFICINAQNEIDNLKRGGSDYSASIIGACVEADEIQIWTDIDGMHNNDPRYVEGTQPVPQLSFEEAAELAYFGAKILHPTCILPAKMKSIPVRLKNTLDPEALGTLISNDYKKGKIEAVAAKDGIAVVRIQSDRMLLAYGFLSRVFSVFEKYKTAIDLIATSEVAVSMSIDDTSNIGAIVNELRRLGTVSFETGLSIISVVGDLRSDNLGFEAKVTEALHDIPVRMISYGGSDHNISLLVRTEDKVKALRSLSKALF